MKLSKIILFCWIGMLATSCGHSGDQAKATAPAPKKTVDISIASLSTPTDPVCGMPLKQGEIGDTLNYQGKVFGFCGTGCKDEFVKSPAQYTAKP